MHPLHLFKFCPLCGSAHFIENNIKSKRCKDCGFVYYFNPSSSTVAIIIDNKQQVLVATRANDPAKGMLDFPGGFIDQGESAEEAVKREVKEETGLEVRTTDYLFSIPNLYLYSGFQVETTDLFFLCRVDNYSFFNAQDDVASLQFIPLTDLNPTLFGLESIRQSIEKLKSFDFSKYRLYMK